MPGVRPLADQDLPQAQKIVRTAFGTFFGALDLDNFWTDFDYVYGRHGAEHVASFAADDEKGHLAGVNFATRWGSVGFFGPLSVRPDLWDKGVATPLVAAVGDQFERWGVSHAGLCTFPHSAKHVWLYQKFGFYPRNLTAIMAAPARPGGGLAVSRYSQLAAGERQEAERASRALSEELFEGLDLGGEIRTSPRATSATRYSCEEARAALTASLSVTGGRRARRAPTVCSSSLARRGPGRERTPASARFSTPAAPLPCRSAWGMCWPGSAPRARRPTVR